MRNFRRARVDFALALRLADFSAQAHPAPAASETRAEAGVAEADAKTCEARTILMLVCAADAAGDKCRAMETACKALTSKGSSSWDLSPEIKKQFYDYAAQIALAMLGILTVAVVAWARNFHISKTVVRTRAEVTELEDRALVIVVDIAEPGNIAEPAERMKRRKRPGFASKMRPITSLRCKRCEPFWGRMGKLSCSSTRLILYGH